MKTKKMCMMALAAILCGTSCTRVDLDELGPSGGGSSEPALTFLNGTNDLNMQLRVSSYPREGKADTVFFDRGDLIGIYMTDTLSNPGFLNVLRENVAYKKMYGDTFLLASGTDSIRLPTSGRVKFFAYYPWDENTGWPDIYWSVSDQTDPSKLDLMMASDNNNGQGFGKITIGASPIIPQPQPPVTLKFRHMLSKVTIIIRASDGTNIDQNSIAQVTMGVIQGSNTNTPRLEPGDTIPLGATFHMDKPEGSNSDVYMVPLQGNIKRGAITFFPATNRTRYTALVIPARYGNKKIGIRLTEKGQIPEDFAATLPQGGGPGTADADQLWPGNVHYIVTASLIRGAVRFDNVTIGPWEYVNGGNLQAQ